MDGRFIIELLDSGEFPLDLAEQFERWRRHGDVLDEQSFRWTSRAVNPSFKSLEKSPPMSTDKTDKTYSSRGPQPTLVGFVGFAGSPRSYFSIHRSDFGLMV